MLKRILATDPLLAYTGMNSSPCYLSILMKKKKKEDQLSELILSSLQFLFLYQLIL